MGHPTDLPSAEQEGDAWGRTAAKEDPSPRIGAHWTDEAYSMMGRLSWAAELLVEVFAWWVEEWVQPFPSRLSVPRSVLCC